MTQTAMFFVYLAGTIIGIAMGFAIGYYVGYRHGRVKGQDETTAHFMAHMERRTR